VLSTVVQWLVQAGSYKLSHNHPTDDPRARNSNTAKMTSEKIQDEARQTATDKKRVLLVDDDAEIIESIRYALEAKGYEIFIARDGNQGLAMAESEAPDLVILDMMMPKRSGFLVLEKLRRTREVPVRVIMITANEGSRHKAYAEMLGVDDYIRKPFAMDKLVDTVQRLLA
jgi:CheY-like chemotaxis protein